MLWLLDVAGLGRISNKVIDSCITLCIAPLHQKCGVYRKINHFPHWYDREMSCVFKMPFRKLLYPWQFMTLVKLGSLIVALKDKVIWQLCIIENPMLATESNGNIFYLWQAITMQRCREGCRLFTICLWGSM